MKLVSLLSQFSALALVATLCGIAFNAFALPLFAAAAASLLLLVCAEDYGRALRAERLRAIARLRSERMPLAA